MKKTLNNDVSPAREEGPNFLNPSAAMSFARLFAARMREVFSVEENRRSADTWKQEHYVEAHKKSNQNG